MEKAELHGLLGLTGLKLRFPRVHSRPNELRQFGFGHRLDVLYQPSGPVLECRDICAGQKVDKRSRLFAGPIAKSVWRDQPLHQPTRLHERQAGVDEPAPDQDFRCPGSILGMHALFVADIARMHDKMIEYDQAIETDRIGIARGQDDNRPQPRFEWGVEYSRPMLWRFYVTHITPSRSRGYRWRADDKLLA